MKHRETHPNLDVGGCFACRISHIRTASINHEITHLTAKERVLDRDLDAYKRIRKSGGQPLKIDGSLKLEQTCD